MAVRGWRNPIEEINLQRPVGGVRVYSPIPQRPIAQPRPVQPTQQQAAPRQPQSAMEQVAQYASGPTKPASSVPSQSGDGGGGAWWQQGLGKLLNNPVTKGILVPLNALDIARRAVILGTEEAAKKLPDFLEPLASPLAPFVDENRDDTRSNWEKLNPWSDEGASYGFGEISKDTGNAWVDRALGFAGDVALDPLTYVGGIGVASKAAKEGAGLTDDAARALTRLTDDLGRTATSRAGVAGRQLRMNRVAEAERFLRNTGLSAEDMTKALDELQDVAGRGLGVARSPIVKEALNIEGPALRMRLPFQKSAGVAVPGTRRVAEKIADTTGNLRFGLNNLGNQGLVAARTGIDYEGAVRVLSQGRQADPESFAKAAETVRLLERARPLTGRYLNLGQRAANEVRDDIRREMSQFDSPAQYLHMIEVGDDEVLRRLGVQSWDQVAGRDIFDYLGFRMPEQELGVTAQRVGSNLNYVPHETTQDFVNWISSGDPQAKAFSAMLEERFGGTPISLLTDSGRSQTRMIGPNMEITLGTKRANTGAGTVQDLNQAMWDLGFPANKKAYVDDPMELVENYVQNMSEDLGRQAARAEMVVDGSKYFAPTPEFIGSPAEAAAKERLNQMGRTGNETPAINEARVAQFADQGDEVSVPLGSETALSDVTEESQRAARQAIIDGEPLGAAYDAEINDLIATYGDIDSVPFPKLEAAGKKLQNLQKEVDDLVTRVGDRAGNEEFARMVDAIIADFKPLSGDTMIDRQIDEMLTNMARQIRNPNMLARALQKATTFFKTYAILSPGFHIRNGLSAIFMNSADGVSLKATSDGFDWWTRFEHAAARDGDGGMAWLARQDELVRNAFDAVFGSGAGGRFKEAGIAESGSAVTRAGKKAIENPVTRFSQRVGARVEGPVRLGMAFDTIRKGGSVQDAVARITRVHFDYSQVSRFDEQMKRIVPFWTFMSRNLPMQVQQMWTRPARYAQYNSLIRNIRGEDPEGMPQYIKDRGGFFLPSPVNLPLLGNINALDPDLPHLRLEEDIARYGDVFQNPGQILSDANPWITAPIEIATRKNLYTGANVGQDEFEHVSNPLEMAMAAFLAPFGAVKRSPDTGEWGIDQAWVGGLQSTVPLVDRATRLTGSGPTGSDRMGETLLRFLGVPVRNITDRQLRNTLLSQQFDQQDLNAQRRGLYQMSQGG